MSSHYTAHETHQGWGHFLVSPVPHDVSGILVVPVALVVVVALANWRTMFGEKPRISPSLPLTMPRLSLREHANRILALFWWMIEKLEHLDDRPEPSPFLRGIEKFEQYGRIAFFVFLGIAALLFLATVAFTPVQMQIFGAWLAINIQWLTGSPDGNRVAAFAGLVLAVVGIYAFIRAIIIRNYGSAAFGWGQVSIGIILVCVAGYGWHLSQIHLLPAIGMVVVGFIIISKGSDNITNDQGAPQSPAPARMQPRRYPSPYGDARPATADKIHNALRDKTPVGGGDRRFKRKD